MAGGGGGVWAASCSYLPQAMRDLSTKRDMLLLTSSTHIHKISSISFWSLRSLSSSATPLATKNTEGPPWESKSMRSLLSMRLWMYSPVSSWTSRAAHSSGLQFWFHLPLGKPYLARTRITRTLEPSRLKMMAPQTGLFSMSLAASCWGTMRRAVPAYSLSLKKNSLRCFSQSLVSFCLRTSSRQQQKAFSAWQLSRLGSSLSSPGKLSRNLQIILSNSSRSRCIDYKSPHPLPHSKNVEALAAKQQFGRLGVICQIDKIIDGTSGNCSQLTPHLTHARPRPSAARPGRVGLPIRYGLTLTRASLAA